MGSKLGTLCPQGSQGMYSPAGKENRTHSHTPQEEMASQSRVLKDPGTKLVEDLQGRWHLNRPAQTNQGSP